jgi:cytochrome b involved in lipid metabolism
MDAGLKLVNPRYPFCSSRNFVNFPETKNRSPGFALEIETLPLKMSLLKEYTLADVALHKKKTDLWIAVHGKGEFILGRPSDKLNLILTFIT